MLVCVSFLKYPFPLSKPTSFHLAGFCISIVCTSVHLMLKPRTQALLDTFFSPFPHLHYPSGLPSVARHLSLASQSFATFPVLPLSLGLLWETGGPQTDPHPAVPVPQVCLPH